MSEQQAAPAKPAGGLPRVMIGMPVGNGSTPWATTMSLLQTLSASREAGLPVTLEAVVGCSVVTWARSAIADAFLKSDCTHLFWIDSDVAWAPSDFFRLVGLGAVLPVVGAAYPFKKLPITFLINFPDPEHYEVNGAGCVKITGMGIGFTLLQRAVVEKVAADKPKRRDPITGQMYADIFRIDEDGEDLAFFKDVRGHGFDAWLDPSITLEHLGPARYKGSVIDALGLQDHAVFQRQVPQETKQ